MVNKAMVREAMVTHKEGRLSCSSRERSKADGKSLNSIVKNPKYKKNFEPLQPSSCSSECVPGRTDEYKACAWCHIYLTQKTVA